MLLQNFALLKKRRINFYVTEKKLARYFLLNIKRTTLWSEVFHSVVHIYDNVRTLILHKQDNDPKGIFRTKHHPTQKHRLLYLQIHLTYKYNQF